MLDEHEIKGQLDKESTPSIKPKQLLETKTDNVLDPRRDSALEPHRNESLWIGTLQETIFIKESMGLGKEKALFIEEDVEIFASYVPSKHQINVLYQGIEQHSKEYKKAVKFSCDRVTAILKCEGNLLAGLYGLCYGTAITVVNFVRIEEDPKLASMALKCMLDQLEPRIKTIYMSELPRDSGTIETLSAFGFHIEETGSCSKINAWATVKKLKKTLEQYGDAPSSVSFIINRLEHYGQDFLGPESKGAKEFEALIKQFNLDFAKWFSKQAELGCPKPPTAPSQLLDLDVLPISSDLAGHEPIKWEKIPVKHTEAVSGSFERPKAEQADQDEGNEPAFEEIFKEIHDRFMFLVQKEDKQIVGGVRCKIEETHLHVEELWLHEIMRGKKLSEKLMDLAEQHAKQKGCTDAGVETASHQSPWLYPKLGYEEVSRLKIGECTAHHFRKPLTHTK